MAIDLKYTDSFVRRHVGPSQEDVQQMLDALGLGSFEALVEATVPASIRKDRRLALPQASTEQELLADLR